MPGIIKILGDASFHVPQPPPVEPPALRFVLGLRPGEVFLSTKREEHYELSWRKFWILTVFQVVNFFRKEQVMLSKFYYSRLNKAVALLTSTLFILGVFSGCAESPKVPTKQATSTSASQSLNRKESSHLGEPGLTGRLVQRTLTPNVSVPLKRNDAQMDVEEQPSSEAVLLSEAERTALIAEALSLQDGQSLKSSLTALGYEMRSDLVVGARKTINPNLGATILVIPFGISNDSTNAAFISYAKREIEYSLNVFFTISQIDSPTVGDYEELGSGLWLLQDPGILFSQSSYDLTEISALSLETVKKANDFAKCLSQCNLAGITGCAVGCLLTGPGWVGCMAACTVGVGAACLVECALEKLFS